MERLSFRTLTAEEAQQYVGDANANKLIPVDENGNVEKLSVYKDPKTDRENGGGNFKKSQKQKKRH